MNKKINLIVYLFVGVFVLMQPGYAEVITGKEIVLKGKVSGTGPLEHLAVTGTVAAGGGRENHYIRIIDYSVPSAPKVASSHEIAEKSYDICAQDSYIYSANIFNWPRKGWLDVLDVTDPYEPLLVCHYQVRDSACGVDVKGDVVYVGDDSAGVTILNVSDMDDPTIIDTYTQRNTEKIVVNGELIVAQEATKDANRLHLYSFINNNIEPLNTINLPGFTRDMEFGESTLYMAQRESGILIYDLSSPAFPVLLSSIDGIGEASGVDIDGTTLYVASGESLLIYDVTDPTSPSLQMECAVDGAARSVKVMGSLIAVGSTDSFQLFELKDVEVKRLVLKGAVYGTDEILHLTNTGEVIAAGGFNTNTVKIFDVSDPTSPTMTYRHQIPDWFTGICSEGNFVYCSNRNRTTREGFLDILDVSDPMAPTVFNHYRTRGLAYGIDVVDHVVMVGDYDKGVTVLDVSSPESPSIIDTYNQYYAAHIEINGNLAALRTAKTNDNHLHIFDVSNKTDIKRLSTLPLPDMSHDLAFLGTTLCLAQNYAGVLIYDVLDPANPVLESKIENLGNASGVDFVDSLLYVAAGQKLLVYDVTYPALPMLKYCYQLDDDTLSVEVRDGLIAVGTEDSLQLFRLEENPLRLSYDASEPIDKSDILQMHWKSGLVVSGSAVKFELWNEEDWVADLGYDWNPAGEDDYNVKFLGVPTGEYWIRMRSTWNPAIEIDGEPFDLISKSNVEPGCWSLYE